MQRLSYMAVTVAFVTLMIAFTGWAQGTKSLYDRLGGRTAIVAVVDEFVANCAGDARINKFFAATAADPKRLATFKNNLVDQVCEASGGPCRYTGKDMKSAHAGLGISNADFNALVEDLTKALDKFKVGKAEQDQLLGSTGTDASADCREEVRSL